MREPLEDAINELKAVSRAVIDADSIANSENNEETTDDTPEVSIEINDEIVMLMVKTIPVRLTAEDIENIKNYEGFEELY